MFGWFSGGGEGAGGKSHHVSLGGVRRGLGGNRSMFRLGCPEGGLGVSGGGGVRGGIADAKGFPPDLSGHKNHAPTSRNCEKEGIPIHIHLYFRVFLCVSRRH